MSRKSKKKNQPSARPVAATTRSPVAPAASRAPVLVRPAEDVEPEADAAAMPVWLFILLIILPYWGMLHLDSYGGGFNQLVYGPYRSYRQLADLQPKSGPEMLVAKGEALYGTICVACHTASGMGSALVPPLAGSEWVLGPPSRLIRIPLHGLRGTIQVKGKTWEGLQMLSLAGTPAVDDDENLAAVLTYIRQAWGNNASPVTPEQVAAVRAETASRSGQWTADELMKIQE